MVVKCNVITYNSHTLGLFTCIHASVAPSLFKTDGVTSHDMYFKWAISKLEMRKVGRQTWWLIEGIFIIYRDSTIFFWGFSFILLHVLKTYTFCCQDFWQGNTNFFKKILFLLKKNEWITWSDYLYYLYR